MTTAVRTIGAGVLAGLCVFAPQVLGQALDIAPISQTLEVAQRTTSFTLVNRSDRPTEVQIRPYRWTQHDQHDQLTATTDLQVSPPFAQIAPGQTQIVRMLVGKSDRAQEQTFRVVFDQLPDADTSKVQLTFRLIVPVFVKGAGSAPEPLAWRLQQSGDQIMLSASNAAGQHVRLTDLRLSDSEGRVFKVLRDTLPYLLADSEGQWRVADPTHLLHSGVRLHLTSSGRLDAQDSWLTLGP